MLKENEFKITAKNLEMESAREIVLTVLGFVNSDKIKVKYSVIRKGEKSIDFSVVIAIKGLLEPPISVIIGYLLSKKGESKSLEVSNEMLNVLKDILDLLKKATEIKPESKADLKTSEFTVPIQNGHAGEPKHFPSVDAASEIHDMDPLEREMDKICSHCGTRNDLDAIYCKQCGSKF